jgi:hypothetical protein
LHESAGVVAGRESGLFDIYERLQRLTDLVDQLEADAEAMDFELFRPEWYAAQACCRRQQGGGRAFM